jgi:hypothetical protein
MSGVFQTGIDFDDTAAPPPAASGSGSEVRRHSTLSISTNNSQVSVTHYPKTTNTGEKLPASVNLVALRESFLSEAPFISNSNRTFWRRMVDNRNFQMLLSASYYIIADCVSETSVVNVEKLQDIDSTSTPLIKMMATNISEMYFSIKLRDRELLFARLPEVLSFMALTALRTSMPKHHRLCLSARFREILIDWYCEVVGGLRFTNCRTNREWLFTDVFDAQIVTTAQLKGQTQTGVNAPMGLSQGGGRNSDNSNGNGNGNTGNTGNTNTGNTNTNTTSSNSNTNLVPPPRLPQRHQHGAQHHQRVQADHRPEPSGLQVHLGPGVSV